MKIKPKSLIALFILSSITFIGCDYNPFTKIQELENEISKLKLELVDKEASIRLNKESIEYLSNRFYESKAEAIIYNKAVFADMTDSKYQRVDTFVGSVLVLIEKVKAHADGVKVTLLVGNLTTAKFPGGSYTAKYGGRSPLLDKDFDDKAYSEWEKNLQTKESNFTNEIKPGFWNIVTLSLPNIKPEQLGYLELSLGFESASLKTIK